MLVCEVPWPVVGDGGQLGPGRVSGGIVPFSEHRLGGRIFVAVLAFSLRCNRVIVGPDRGMFLLRL